MADRPETLRVSQAGQTIFSSNGKWLHPLFDLGDHLGGLDCDPATLCLEDSVVGKAAAFLVWRLGIRTIKAGVLSRRAQAVLESAGIDYRYDELVDRILCQTEDLLAAVTDPEEAHRILRERAGR